MYYTHTQFKNFSLYWLPSTQQYRKIKTYFKKTHKQQQQQKTLIEKQLFWCKKMKYLFWQHTYTTSFQKHSISFLFPARVKNEIEASKNKKNCSFEFPSLFLFAHVRKKNHSQKAEWFFSSSSLILFVINFVHTCFFPVYEPKENKITIFFVSLME